MTRRVNITKSIYTRRNHIYFLAPITKNSIFTLKDEIYNLNKKYEELQQYIKSPNPIYLHLNTEGGDVQAGWVGVSAIQNSKVPIHTIIEGECASAGTYMSVAGKKRYMTKYSRMLIHQISSNINGTYRELEDEIKGIKMDMNQSIDFYNKHTLMNKRDIREQLKHDRWWDIKTAQKNGFIDAEWTAT